MSLESHLQWTAALTVSLLIAFGDSADEICRAPMLESYTKRLSGDLKIWLYASLFSALPWFNAFSEDLHVCLDEIYARFDSKHAVNCFWQRGKFCRYHESG